jgi:hypothetical protein
MLFGNSEHMSMLLEESRVLEDADVDSVHGV